MCLRNLITHYSATCRFLKGSERACRQDWGKGQEAARRTCRCLISKVEMMGCMKKPLNLLDQVRDISVKLIPCKTQSGTGESLKAVGILG